MECVPWLNDAGLNDAEPLVIVAEPSTAAPSRN